MLSGSRVTNWDLPLCPLSIYQIKLDHTIQEWAPCLNTLATAKLLTPESKNWVTNDSLSSLLATVFSYLLTHNGLKTLVLFQVLSLQVALLEDITLTFQSCPPLTISNILPQPIQNTLLSRSSVDTLKRHYPAPRDPRQPRFTQQSKKSKIRPQKSHQPQVTLESSAPKNPHIKPASHSDLCCFSPKQRYLVSCVFCEVCCVDFVVSLGSQLPGDLSLQCCKPYIFYHISGSGSSAALQLIHAYLPTGL